MFIILLTIIAPITIHSFVTLFHMQMFFFCHLSLDGRTANSKLIDSWQPSKASWYWYERSREAPSLGPRDEFDSCECWSAHCQQCLWQCPYWKFLQLDDWVGRLALVYSTSLSRNPRLGGRFCLDMQPTTFYSFYVLTLVNFLKKQCIVRSFSPSKIMQWLRLYFIVSHLFLSFLLHNLPYNYQR